VGVLRVLLDVHPRLFRTVRLQALVPAAVMTHR
jgi:hypothetical protein